MYWTKAHTSRSFLADYWLDLIRSSSCSCANHFVRDCDDTPQVPWTIQLRLILNQGKNFSIDRHGTIIEEEYWSVSGLKQQLVIFINGHMLCRHCWRVPCPLTPRFPNVSLVTSFSYCWRMRSASWDPQVKSNNLGVKMRQRVQIFISLPDQIIWRTSMHE